MLRVLEQSAPPADAEIWSRMYAALQHQGDIAPAAYAAVPHLARLAEKERLPRRLDVLCFVEPLAVRSPDRAPPDLRADYLGALANLRPIALDVTRAAAKQSSYRHVLAPLIAATIALRAGPAPGLASFDSLSSGSLYGQCPACGRSLTLRLSAESVAEDEGLDARAPSGHRLTPQRIITPGSLAARLPEARMLLATDGPVAAWEELALAAAAALTEELGQSDLCAAILQLDTVIECQRCTAAVRVLEHDVAGS